MITLQNCLDKIGFSGTPEITLVHLNDLFSKFIRECPLSTIHVNGTLLNDAEASKTRVITNGVGGTCVALSVTFKFMLDQIGFDCEYISIKRGGVYNREIGLMVTLGSDSYVLIFGYYNVGINRPIKIQDGFKSGNIEVQFLNPEYSVKNMYSNSEKIFLTESRDISYFTTSIESDSQSGGIVNNDFLSIYLGGGLYRTYLNGKIKDADGSSYDYDNQVHNLLTLFKFSGTI